MCLSAAFTAVCQGFPKGGVKVTLGVNEEGQLWEESRTQWPDMQSALPS